MKIGEFWEKLDFIREYADFEGCEMGEYWHAFLECYNVADSNNIYGDGEFYKAYMKEFDRIYKDISENYKIKEDKWKEEVFKDGKLVKTITKTDKRLIHSSEPEFYDS